ncbi:MAG: hypothetical protein ACR2NH_12405, partial [Solirubrobacteraceae bacterium]
FCAHCGVMLVGDPGPVAELMLGSGEEPQERDSLFYGQATDEQATLPEAEAPPEPEAEPPAEPEAPPEAEAEPPAEPEAPAPGEEQPTAALPAVEPGDPLATPETAEPERPAP